METQVNATVEAPILGEFMDDALEGASLPSSADRSEIEKTHFLGEFVDDAVNAPESQHPVSTLGRDAATDDHIPSANKSAHPSEISTTTEYGATA